jgi:hypothetical protein
MIFSSNMTPVRHGCSVLCSVWPGGDPGKGTVPMPVVPAAHR